MFKTDPMSELKRNLKNRLLNGETNLFELFIALKNAEALRLCRFWDAHYEHGKFVSNIDFKDGKTYRIELMEAKNEDV